jgi:hypothetical protein
MDLEIIKTFLSENSEIIKTVGSIITIITGLIVLLKYSKPILLFSWKVIKWVLKNLKRNLLMGIKWSGTKINNIIISIKTKHDFFKKYDHAHKPIMCLDIKFL